MISVVIATHESERPLVRTLAALVPAVLEGLVREVIVADGGSSDGTATVADVAGCRFMTIPGPLGARLAAASAAARSEWLLFLPPGSIPVAGWIEEAERFVRDSALADRQVPRAAVFRPGTAVQSILAAALARAAALGALPKPSQGLLIHRTLYDELGGHDAANANPETALLRRIGRRRIVVLDCALAQPRNPGA
jgi:glycosyltransferase involved in cell wall biosynthesis